MIVYSDKCLSCAYKDLRKKLRAFSRKHNLPFEVRRTNAPIYKAQAEDYGVSVPFVVHGKVALNLNEDLEELLK